MHRIIFIPCDAPKPVPLFGSGIWLIIVIVGIPGGRKKIYNFKNNRARKTNVRRQIYSPWILFVYKAHLSFRQPIRTFFPIYPPLQLLLETNNKIPKAFSNFKAWGIFQYYPDRNPSTTSLKCKPMCPVY